MRNHVFGLLAILVAGSTFLNAQASRTWVAGTGDDANPCSRTAPCKTFAGAISKTAAGGEINAIDPSGYGTVTITKSITIDGGAGQVASVLAAGNNGIVVSAGQNDVVTLRNLRINGIGNSNTPGVNGVRWLGGEALHIENCNIFGFSNNGIDIAKSDGGKAYVDDTIVADTNNGLSSENNTSTVFISISKSRFLHNQAVGVLAGNFSSVSADDSEASGNGSVGFYAHSDAGNAELNLSNSIVANNGSVGIAAGGGGTLATVRMTGVSLFGNANGLFANPNNGAILTYGNNYNAGTGSPSGRLTPQ